MIRILTHSSRAAYLLCPRKYGWRYSLGYRRIAPPSEALRLGTEVHRGLALLASEPLFFDAADWTTDPVARAMLDGYRARWMPLSYRSEVGFERPIYSPSSGRWSTRWHQAGVVDGILDDGSIIEHKTASSLEGYLEGLWADAQVHGYAAALGASRVLYDVVRKPGFRRGEDESDARWAGRLALYYRQGITPGRVRARGGETDEEYLARLKADGEHGPLPYLREELVIDPDSIREWSEDTWAIAHAIADSHRLDRWPRNTAACYHWGSACQYMPLCSAGHGCLDAILASDYEKTELHPELRRGQKS
jgi:hypothetical protein